MAVTQIRGGGTGSQIKAGTITGTEINASAAIPLGALAEPVIQADGGQAFTGNQAMGGFKLTGLGTPTDATDAATLAYVQGVAAGIKWKASVRLATAAALPAYTQADNKLTATGNAALTVDGVAVADGDRILLKNGANDKDNGIYVVTDKGSAGTPFVLDRSSDADTSAEVVGGIAVWVNEGTVNADSGWTLTTNDPITLNTTNLAFTQFTGLGQITAGDGLSQTANTLAVKVAATGGIEIASDELKVKLDGSSLSVGANGIKVNMGKFHNLITPTGDINGSNVTFVLSATPISGTEMVFMDGLVQEAGAGNDYTISADTITYLAAPISGNKLRVCFWEA